MSDISPAPLPEPAPESAGIPPAAPSTRARVEPEKSSMDSGEMVSIIAIVAVTVVALCCIGTCALIGFAFLQNPPW